MKLHPIQSPFSVKGSGLLPTNILRRENKMADKNICKNCTYKNNDLSCEIEIETCKTYPANGNEIGEEFRLKERDLKN